MLRKLPLITTESRETYDALRQAVLSRVRPRDVFEELYLDEFICAQLEVDRYIRAKRGVLDLAVPSAVDKLLKYSRENALALDIDGHDKAVKRNWLGDPQFRKNYLAQLEKSGLSGATIEGMAIEDKIESLVRIDFLLERAEKRRDKSLTTLTEYRREYGEVLRGLTDTDGARELEPPPATRSVTRREH
jgi:hypothetical protein